MRYLIIIATAISLSACAGKRTVLVPQPYMPKPPSILMQEPQELSVIRNKGVLENEEFEIEEDPAL